MNNAAILLQLLIQLGNQVASASEVLANAQAQGRDVTAEELAAASSAAQAAIDAAARS